MDPFDSNNPWEKRDTEKHLLEKNGSTVKSEEKSDDDLNNLTPRTFKRRWIMVFLFAFLSMSNAYQWIHLNIIFNVIHRYYNESLPGDTLQQEISIHWLSMIYMLAYIPLIWPVTWLLDKKGLRIVGIIAAFLNALGAWIKCAAIKPDRFAVLMLGQTICAIGQVFILGIPARLAAVWFGSHEVSTATAMGVFGNQIGCAVGFLIPPEIVPDVEDFDILTKKLRIMLYGTAGYTTLLMCLVLAIYREKPPVPPSQAQVLILQAAEKENYFSSLRRLVTNWGFILLTITYGANTGSYYAIGTLLNLIVLHYFPNSLEDAGRIGLTLVLAGVLGSILAGIWLDRSKMFKWTTVGIYLMSFIGMIVFTFTLSVNRIWVAYLCSGALGFFMTGYLPVGFEFAAELTYPESEGTSSGFLNASAQAFGIALTLGMGSLINKYGPFWANIAICITLLVGTIGTCVIKSDLRRQRAAKTAIEQDEKYLELSVSLEEKKKLTNGDTTI